MEHRFISDHDNEGSSRFRGSAPLKASCLRWRRRRSGASYPFDALIVSFPKRKEERTEHEESVVSGEGPFPHRDPLRNSTNLLHQNWVWRVQLNGHSCGQPEEVASTLDLSLKSKSRVRD